MFKVYDPYDVYIQPSEHIFPKCSLLPAKLLQHAFYTLGFLNMHRKTYLNVSFFIKFSGDAKF